MALPRTRSMKRFKANSMESEVSNEKIFDAPTHVPVDSLRTLVDEADKTDELMDQLVKTTKNLQEAEKRASQEAVNLFSMMQNLARSESDLCSAKAILAKNQRELLKLRGIHKICEAQALAPTSIKSDRARRLEHRNSSKILGPGVLLTDVQIQEQINEAKGLIALANERFKFKDELFKSLARRQTQSRSEIVVVRKQTKAVDEQIAKLREVHKNCISRVSADMLPENVLLHIFQYLGKSTLMNKVGLVCKTWRRVSKDYSLWKNEKLVLHSTFALAPSLREKICYLRIAPCLKSLVLQFPDNSPKLDSLLSNCGCKISKLKVILRNFHHLSLLTRFLESQKESLTELYIDDNNPKSLDRSENSVARLLWLLVGEMSKLKNLHIKNSTSLLKIRCKASEFPALNLEEIIIQDCFVHSSSALSKIVKASSSSLQVLELPPDVDGNVLESLALMNCSKLRVLQIPCFPGISAIDHCSQLTNLKLCSKHPTAATISLVSAFLKSSSMIRNLEKFEVLGGSNVGCCDILAQAISRMPNLRELKLKGSSQHPVNNLFTLFHSVPLLEKLDCNTFPLTIEDVNQFISTNILPKLEVMNIPTVFNNSNKHHCLLDLKDNRKNLLLTGMYSDNLSCYCSDCYDDSDSLNDYSTDEEFW